MIPLAFLSLFTPTVSVYTDAMPMF